MRTTIRLPDDLYRRAKIAAAAQGCSFTVFLEDAVRRSLAGENLPAAEEPYTVDPLPHAGGVPDGVDLADNRGLAELMDAG